MTTLADKLMPDALWQRIQPLPPPPPSRARGGVPRTVPDRACMAGPWLGGFRRLRIRYECRSERFYALVMLACSVICFSAFQRPPW